VATARISNRSKRNKRGSAFADYVAASIAHFVWLEVGNLIQTLPRLWPVATGWPWAAIAVIRMETVVHVAMEPGGTMKPRACPDEDSSYKPFRAIIPIGSTIVRRHVVVPIRTHRRNSNLNAYLSLHCGSSQREADCGNCS
jgi:hypothetical protein